MEEKKDMPDGITWPRFKSGGPVGIGNGFTDRAGIERTVMCIRFYSDMFCIHAYDDTLHYYSYGDAVAPEPFFAADGKLLEAGQTVWDMGGNGPYKVVRFTEQGYARIKSDFGLERSEFCERLTHQRPALDAEGNRIETAMDVWWICEGDERGIHAEKLLVESIGEDGLVTCDPFNGGTWVELDSTELYVNKPVLDADGVPIKVDDTVWDTKGNGPYIIKKIENDGVIRIEGSDLDYFGYEFVHERPDTWERIEDDAGCTATKYNERRGTTFTTKQQVARDLVRRAKKLAGVSE